jgi:hypothetical protein
MELKWKQDAGDHFGVKKLKALSTESLTLNSKHGTVKPELSNKENGHRRLRRIPLQWISK